VMQPRGRSARARSPRRGLGPRSRRCMRASEWLGRGASRLD